jgi:hypothetical protein
MTSPGRAARIVVPLAAAVKQSPTSSYDKVP